MMFHRRQLGKVHKFLLCTLHDGFCECKHSMEWILRVGFRCALLGINVLVWSSFWLCTFTGELCIVGR
jgi:hypothetical protein